MNFTPTNRYIIKIAGFSGTVSQTVKMNMIYLTYIYLSAKIQALAWIGMTLAAIIIYLGSIQPTFDVNQYFDTVQSIIYTFSLHGLYRNVIRTCMSIIIVDL